jgi:hypothetical protein
MGCFKFRCRRPVQTVNDFATRWRTIILLLFMFIDPASAFSQEIWFGPNAGTVDYMALFEPNAPWRQVSSQVKVLAVAGDANTAMRLDLPRALAGLKARHIALTIGSLPLTGDGCGFGVEGYSASGQPLADSLRLNAAGADVRYVMMDEPLYYGHVYNGKNACHSSIAEIAKDVALKVKQMQSVYPGVALIDVEPVGIPNENWDVDLERWFDAYEAATGQRLAFFCADIQWNAQWQRDMRKLIGLLRRKGIPLQVIYNGNGDARSDEQWVAQAVAHFKQYETILPPPAVATFMTWDAHPTHNLPETDPWTMTGLIRKYVAWTRSR